MVDVHHSVIRYVACVLPKNNPNCFIPNSCHYSCDQLLSELYEHETYYPENVQLKWRMIVRNFTEIDGQPYVLRPSAHVTTPKEKKVPTPKEIDFTPGCHTVVDIDLGGVICGQKSNSNLSIFFIVIVLCFLLALCLYQILITDINSDN